MFFPEGQIRVHLYGVPADMRKSFDGLSALARNAMGFDPLSGHLFVFINRRATQIKVLYFDRSGFACGPSAWKRDALWATGPRCAARKWTGRN